MREFCVSRLPSVLGRKYRQERKDCEAWKHSPIKHNSGASDSSLRNSRLGGQLATIL